MKSDVEKLFHELADRSAEERSYYFAENAVTEETRQEVEALLAFDTGASSCLERDIGLAAGSAMAQLEGKDLRCGPYRLLEMIGRGGMGAVYLAERADGEIIHQVAVKLLPPGAGSLHEERFLQERQILASLSHPNIARMLDVGHAQNGQPFLAMEYVDGKPIDVHTTGLSTKEKVALFLKVCAAVSYLHRNLIVHRDLKPSNVLVNAEGEPKLLDFGIAKMLDAATDSALTQLRMMTPDYASPEQVRGLRISTATDIYSLAAVLYQLLTGRPPHEFEERSPEGIAREITSREVTRPSKWSLELKGDLEAILLKALRKDPQERYGTVEQLADDLLAFLESRSVRARSGNAWYRTRKFVRRYWLPVGAASVVMASLATGLYVANRERVLAQKRFGQVRQLANKVLALDSVVRVLPGSTKARSEIVAMSQQYLEGLGADVRADPDLALEVARAYLVLAGVQGLPAAANLGQIKQADASLRKADNLLEDVLKSAPSNRKAWLLAADVARNRMIVASTDHRREETIAEAKQAADRLDTFLMLGPPAPDEVKTPVRIFANIALAYKNLHLYAEATRYARRSIEVARSSPLTSGDMGQPLSVLADSLRFSGDLEGALEAIQEARRQIETTAFAGDAARRQERFNVLWREGTILGQDGNISLDRPVEATASLQEAFDVAEGWARQDPDEAHSRDLVAMAARELGRILAHSDPSRALKIYDQALVRLGEIKDNLDARRDEARLLAYSSAVLRRLHRPAEGKARIDAAFQIVRNTHDYPSDRINPDHQVYAVVKAWGDHLAETNQLQQAAQVYEELLNGVLAYKPEIENDISDASKLSELYEALAAADRRAGRSGEAVKLETRRLEIWKYWDRKIPRNPFVQRQIAAVRSVGS